MLCRLLLGVRSLQSFMTERRRTKRQRSSLLERSSAPATTKKLGKDSLLVSEFEVGDLSFLSIRWGEDQTFLLEGWGSSTLSS